MSRNKNKNRIFRFNRRIRGLTDYHLRLRLLKSKLVRVVVRKSNKGMLVQFVRYKEDGDIVIASARASELEKLGFTLNTGNLCAAYLTGMLAAKRAAKLGFKEECISDLGLQRSLYGNRLYAALKGVKDGGAQLRIGDMVFPSEERLNGEHLKGKGAKEVIEKTKKALEAMK